MILELLLFSVILITASTSAQATCNRVCRGEGGRESSVSYPFGFSDGCEIRLDCSVAGEIRVGEYTVRNMSRDRLLVDFPAKCGRPYNEIHVFDNTNLAITSRNGFLVENCSSTLNDCRVQIHFNVNRCADSGIDNSMMKCYSGDNPNRAEFMNLKRLDAAGCRNLFTSFAIDRSESGSSSTSTNTNAPVSLEFQSLELGWWVRGGCSCDQNAVCRNVVFENRRRGYRCRCNEGYAGDGFVDGDGCRRVEEDDGATDWGLIISIFVGFIIGFWIIVAPLIVSRSLRIAYFRNLSKLRYMLYDVIRKVLFPHVFKVMNK